MGAADIVPGVSGGTMAFILGIYQELLNSIKSADSHLLRLLLKLRFREASNYFPWRFLAAVGAGIFMAILTLAKVLETQLETNPTKVWSFFFGLVLASIFTVARSIKGWKPSLILIAAISCLVSYSILGVAPTTTPETTWFLFLSGAIAINAMILPGISGAYILVLLGKYKYILSAVNSRDILTLAIVLAGAAIGLTTFVRLLSWLLDKYRNITMTLLTGLMIGSLRRLWPWKSDTNPMNPILPETINNEILLSIAIAIAGMMAILIITKISANMGRSSKISG
jgi:putative membrane protein